MHNRPLSLRPLALALLLACSGAATAQSNITGSIYGSAQPGQTVVVRNLDTGLTRSVTVGTDGKYRALALPTGQYQIELQSGGAVVAQREVLVQIASGSQIDFVATPAAGADATTLDAVTVRGNLAALDMSQTDVRSVFTAADLEMLPLGGNLQDIASVALLAPGVVASTGSNLVSFGGSSGAENAYFINGFPVTNPLTNLGYKSLPFRAIDQEQVLTGGYGAEFGRSTGGVINIVTKRGSNEWHGGTYVRWTPMSLKGKPKNEYYPNTGYWNSSVPGVASKDWSDGQLYIYRRDNGTTSTSAGIWTSGPLVKDRLFLFANVERQRTDGQSNSTQYFGVTGSPTGWNDYRYTYPRWAGKLDWNITDNQVLELTAIQDRVQYETYKSSWDNATLTHGSERAAVGEFTDDDSRLYVAKYTNYLTDNLTVSALVGTQKIEHNTTTMGLGPDSCVNFTKPSTANQVPGLTYIETCQPVREISVPGAFDKTEGWRLDVAWTLGNHELHFGVDNLDAESRTGTRYTGLPNGDAVGPGNAAYGYWVFTKTNKPNSPINGSVGAPGSAGGYGPQGYYAYYVVRNNLETPSTEQRSQFIEDRWQITDNLLLSLGLRNEQFTNYTSAGVAYMEQKWQPAPRLGFTWNVNGDNSLKLYGNLGRYHMALPARIAMGSVLSSRIRGNQYYTYTGIDPQTGAPTGLTKIPVSTAPTAAICPGTNLYSSNFDCGVAKDPRERVAADLKPMFQDELILGLDQVLTPTWNWGVKGTYRKLQKVVDDSCPDIFNGNCYIVNAGESNTFWEKQSDGSYQKVTYTAEQLGMPKARRTYFALDFYLDHPMSDNWSAKFLYTYSRSAGNTEGPVNSDRASGGDSGLNDSTSTTQDYDKTLLMERAYGLLNNDRRHQFKAYGTYRFNEEWSFGGSMTLASGRPVNCYAHYPTPLPSYDSAYYWYCGLPGTPEFKETSRGSEGRTPWLYTFNVSANYAPQWAKGLKLSVDVMNLFDTRTAVIYNTQSTSSHTQINKLWGKPDYNDPRTVTFTASYSF